MQLRVFTTLSVCAIISILGSQSFSQTDESLNNELNAAESAAGGGYKPAPAKELKSDGDTLDAVGIPSDTDTPQNNSLSPAPPPARPVTKKPVAKNPPPPPVEKPAPVPAPEIPPPPPLEVKEEIPPPAEAPPPTEATSEPAETPESDTLDLETPVEAPAPEDKQTEDQKICNCRFKPGTPYRDRRPRFTGIFGIEGGTYAPTNFNSQITSGQTYSSLYSGSALPNMELVFGTKFNFLLGSIGAQFTGGYFSANNSNQSSSLTVEPLTLGLVYTLDTIFKEPYVAPYVVAGMYTDFWNESVQGLSASGRTSFAPFYAIGLLFQLDWLDTETHETGYKDFGMENTFLFLEARSFLPSNDLPIDFSTPLQISGGFKFEF